MGKTATAGRARHRLSDAALQLIAARFKVLSEPTRLKLLLALETGERNVTELVAAVGSTQANVSRQLQVLERAGIVTRRRMGVMAYYSIVDAAIFALCDHVCGSLRKQLARQANTARLFAGAD
jgi:ArsR family transcriptional regulator